MVLTVVLQLYNTLFIGVGSLLARFQLSEGPSKPSPLVVQFTSEGSTLSGCDIELVGAGYRFSLIKKRFAAGKWVSFAKIMLPQQLFLPKKKSVISSSFLYSSFPLPTPNSNLSRKQTNCWMKKNHDSGLKLEIRKALDTYAPGSGFVSEVELINHSHYIDVYTEVNEVNPTFVTLTTSKVNVICFVFLTWKLFFSNLHRF